jgi:hypothetical protein
LLRFIKEKTMTYRRAAKAAANLRLVLLAAVIGVSATGTSFAGPLVPIRNAPSYANNPMVNLGDLAGNWVLTLYDTMGCGLGTMYGRVTLNASGAGTVHQRQHTAGCGDMTGSFPFSITSLKYNGSGTAGLVCGSDCGWTFEIQVSVDRDEIALVDISDPNNYLQGMLVRQ